MVRSILILLCTLFLGAQDVRLQVVATTDLQGRILPRDAYTMQPAPLGWAMAATLVRNLKAGNPNTVLLDCGDNLSGDPAAYVHSQVRPDLPEPSVAVMNALGYHAMAVGGREFDFGFSALRAAEEVAQFPFLSANTVFAATGKGVFTPYIKFSMGGVQVAVLGLTAASLPRGMGAARLADLAFQDPVETAKALVPKLRDKEKADVVIVLVHSSLGKGPCQPMGPEPARCLAEQVPGIDLIISGNGGSAQATQVGGVPILQPGPLGQAVGVADVRLRKERFRWKVDGVAMRLEQPKADTVQDPQVMELTAALRGETEAYLDTFATRLANDLDGRWSRMEDTALVQLLQNVMRQAAGAQLAAAASPGARIYIPKGPTSVRQFYALAPEEDRVARIRITGAQLRKYLEQAARFYNHSYEPDLFNRDFPPGDYDMVSGVEYALDLTRPAGQRVVSLTYRNEPVTEKQSFTLALPTSRLGGKGGYLEAMGFTGEPEAVTQVSFRNLLLDYVLSQPALSVPLDGNWRTIPYLDRERVLAQQP
ncbi:MAG TPA: bifunctional UDP-sugar hydrolase/5'-nucleotidase [Holophaga sp.]|nr:bifunctional UDP-sugar hydrolase/5'-nucleotidase [Holophaga sp.]